MGGVAHGLSGLSGFVEDNLKVEDVLVDEVLDVLRGLQHFLGEHSLGLGLLGEVDWVPGVPREVLAAVDVVPVLSLLGVVVFGEFHGGLSGVQVVAVLGVFGVLGLVGQVVLGGVVLSRLLVLQRFGNVLHVVGELVVVLA